MAVVSTSRHVYDLLNESIRSKSAKVGVIGLGYVGLPLLKAFIRGGYDTIGFDIDESKVQRLMAGDSYIHHVPSSWIAEWLEKERFSATSDMSRMAESDVLIICVPTPLNDAREPDLTYIQSTGKQIAAAL